MRQLPNLFLLLSSICCCVLISCSISKFKHPSTSNKVIITKDAFAPILQNNKASKYKATIDVLKNHLSGILIVKQTDSVATHLIFVTELGMKMFDFEYKNKVMSSVYVFEPLNKPSLINALHTNFKNIFLFDVYDAEAFYCSKKTRLPYYKLTEPKNHFIVADTIKGISEQFFFNNNRKGCVINYTFNPELKLYSQIKCTQFGIVKIRTELETIE